MPRVTLKASSVVKFLLRGVHLAIKRPWQPKQTDTSPLLTSIFYYNSTSSTSLGFLVINLQNRKQI